jgi:hypothetical protein
MGCTVGIGSSDTGSTGYSSWATGTSNLTLVELGKVGTGCTVGTSRAHGNVGVD